MHLLNRRRSNRSVDISSSSLKLIRKLGEIIRLLETTSREFNIFVCLNEWESAQC